MQFLWKYIDDLVGKGLETKVLGEFLLYSSASMVPMALPLAILLASLMTFGNLAQTWSYWLSNHQEYPFPVSWLPWYLWSES